jgi:hypothetical protein
VQRTVGRNDRSILADPAVHWAEPPQPGFDPNRTYPDRPIWLTYPLPCKKTG